MEAQAVIADMLGERAALSAHAARARQDHVQAQSPREAWPASSPNSKTTQEIKASAAKLASGALGPKLRQKIHLLARPAYLEVAKPESYRPETYRPQEDGDPSRAATKRELVASFDRRVAEVIGPIAPPSRLRCGAGGARRRAGRRERSAAAGPGGAAATRKGKVVDPCGGRKGRQDDDACSAAAGHAGEGQRRAALTRLAEEARAWCWPATPRCRAGKHPWSLPLAPDKHLCSNV